MPNWKKLIVSGSDANLNSLTVENSLIAKSLTGSLEYSTLNNIPAGIVSSSSQVDVNQVQGYTSFSSSIISSINTEKSRIDTILAASDADKDSFAEIVSLINSVDTENDTAFASYVTSNNNRSTQIETDLTDLSSSVNTRIDNISTDYSDLTNIPSGIVSSSTQITGDLNVNSVTASFFVGDGSQLTNVETSIVETSTIVDSFSNKTSISVPHNFDTKNVIISVFNSNDEQIIPASIITTDTNTVDVTFERLTSGRVVVAKGGHRVTGVYVDQVSTLSNTFTDVVSHTVSHTFNTKDVYVIVYDNNDEQIIPESVITTSDSTVTVNFNRNTTGRVLVAKAGHVVSGSMSFNNITDLPTLISGSDQITGSLDSRYVNNSEVTGSNVVGSDTVTSIETMTSAAYAAITPQTNVLYIITD